MAYAQILRALHRNVQQAAAQYAVQTRKVTQVSPLIQAQRRTVSTVSRLALHSRAGAAPSALPALSSFVQAQRQRGIFLDFAARSQNSPDDRDTYGSGSPKPSDERRVKAAMKMFTYLVIVVYGFFVIVYLAVLMLRQMFPHTGPNKIYGETLDKVKFHPEVIGTFGEPIRCYDGAHPGGMNRRVSRLEYLRDGLKHNILLFNIKGSKPGLRGTVHSESEEDIETGKREFRYIFVEIDTYPRRTIIVEDNR